MQQFVSRTQYAYQVRSAVGLDPDRYFASSSGYGGRTPVWTPDDFSQARLAAWGWLYRFALDQRESDVLIDKVARRQKPKAPACASSGIGSACKRSAVRPKGCCPSPGGSLSKEDPRRSSITSSS